MTVAQYFELQAKKNPVYARYLNKGKLKYPALPTINIGSSLKPVLVPAELISVPGGQSRSQVLHYFAIANNTNLIDNEDQYMDN